MEGRTMHVDPGIQEQREFYDDWNTRHRNGAFEEITEEIRLRGARVLDLVKGLGLNRPHILEVGCGTGWLSEKLAEVGDVTGIDLSPAAIALAEERNIGARFVAGDFYEYDFNGMQFDVCVCMETLFYVPDQPRFVERLAEHTGDGGYLVLTAINSFVYERSSDIPPPAPGQLRRWMNARKLERLLSGHFVVLSKSTVAPRGNRGILRLVNSHKLNALLSRVVSRERIRRIKERLGLGGGIVILAKKGGR
jgi:2-polyprenyl-3-methyl-5-hydroxy-6-metoxy-1,4-benzoquinol methylase